MVSIVDFSFQFPTFEIVFFAKWAHLWGILLLISIWIVFPFYWKCQYCEVLLLLMLLLRSEILQEYIWCIHITGKCACCVTVWFNWNHFDGTYNQTHRVVIILIKTTIKIKWNQNFKAPKEINSLVLHVVVYSKKYVQFHLLHGFFHELNVILSLSRSLVSSFFIHRLLGCKNWVRFEYVQFDWKVHFVSFAFCGICRLCASAVCELLFALLHMYFR